MKTIGVLMMLVGAAACGGGGGPQRPDDSPGSRRGSPSMEAALPEKVVQINAPGAEVDIEAALVPGYVVIVDFWAEWCGACKTMEAKFMPLIEGEPRILVRKVDVGDGDTPVADQYDVGPLPHLRIYDGRGELRYVLQNNEALETGEKALELLREVTAAN